jgi:hypothetical protein
MQLRQILVLVVYHYFSVFALFRSPEIQKRSVFCIPNKPIQKKESDLLFKNDVQ